VTTEANDIRLIICSYECPACRGALRSYIPIITESAIYVSVGIKPDNYMLMLYILTIIDGMNKNFFIL
ncbi:hypothetical protein SB776_39175, partial [Burkholderia sp. SIMBA_045]